ncbi:hypothetical protein EJB05_36964 [Eragrostis curvula]|uniref:F-box domain-containing protein n=1 Tax=Eragrostis curvula TaxID=38414 RepID=A0A5J9TZJ3_9POAL|nr:hypothetical protein EJB05_36964 [Eragrostis curvula]
MRVASPLCPAARDLFDEKAETGGDKKPVVPDLEDRISALPDGVLEHIIGFLPADQSVRTSLLARRWRHLWSSMRCLRITHLDRCSSNFRNFMDGLLLLRNPSVALDEVQLLPSHRLGDDSVPYLNICIKHRLFCQAKMLTIGRRVPLDGRPLLSEHLRRLELVSLDLNGNSLDFERCRLLEDLRISECDLHTARIFSQSVKHLSITCCDFENPQRTHISAPSLLSLQLCYSFGYAPLLEKIPSLESAVFNGPADFYAHEGWESCDACRKCWCYTDPIVDDILGSLSMTVKLKLICTCSWNKIIFLIKAPKGLQFHYVVCFKSSNSNINVPNNQCMALIELHLAQLILGRRCPTFSRLKTLLLILPGEANDLYSLVRILERSPILEKLTLQLSGGYKWTGESEGRYRPSDQLPAISELLDMVEIKCRKIDERVSYIMEFLGGFIKHININLDSKPSTGSRQAPGSAAGWSMDGLYLDS